MANATLSPSQLAALLGRLDDAQRHVKAVRDQLIQAMAARHRLTEPQKKGNLSPRTKRRR